MRELIIYCVAGFVASLCVYAALAVYFHRKSAAERAKALEKLNQMADKVMESNDDPNEPARFVP